MKRLLLLSLLIFGCNNQPNIESQEDGPKIKSIYEAEIDAIWKDALTRQAEFPVDHAHSETQSQATDCLEWYLNARKRMHRSRYWYLFHGFL